MAKGIKHKCSVVFLLGREPHSYTLVVFKLKFTSVFNYQRLEIPATQDGAKAGGGGTALLVHHTDVGQNPARQNYMGAPLQTINLPPKFPDKKNINRCFFLIAIRTETC